MEEKFCKFRESGNIRECFLALSISAGIFIYSLPESQKFSHELRQRRQSVKLFFHGWFMLCGTTASHTVTYTNVYEKQLLNNTSLANCLLQVLILYTTSFQYNCTYKFSLCFINTYNLCILCSHICVLFTLGTIETF